jgi:hypothetical protein
MTFEHTFENRDTATEAMSPTQARYMVDFVMRKIGEYAAVIAEMNTELAAAENHLKYYQSWLAELSEDEK